MEIVLFIIIITVVGLICFNPYVDIQEDSVIIWYNWFGERKFYIIYQSK